jgi:hypothetical protein
MKDKSILRCNLLSLGVIRTVTSVYMSSKILLPQFIGIEYASLTYVILKPFKYRYVSLLFV